MVDRAKARCILLLCALAGFPFLAAAAETSPPAARGFVPLPTRPPRPQAAEPPHGDTPRTLAAAYYSLKSGLDATLMLSNQGPHPMAVQIRLFSLGGDTWTLAPVTLAAEEVRAFSLRDSAPADPAFAEGSLEVGFRGKNLELGGVLSLTDAARSLIFDEELSEPATQFASSRLEGVWWAPAPTAELRLALANTTGLPVKVTVRLEGAARQKAPMVVELEPHATRVLGFGQLAGRPGRALPRTGGISVTHSGPPGGVLARALVREPALGYSDGVELIDPERAKSSSLHGTGLRLGRVAGSPLVPVLVARNVTGRAVTVSGRIPYVTRDGEESAVPLPRVRLAAREVREIDVLAALRQQGLRRIAAAGVELEHDGAPGSVVAKALAMSASGTHVFRVPLVDAALASSTGIYPWSLEGGTTAVIYVKNATAEPRDYTLHLDFPGGTYVLGLQTLAPRQTVAIDLRDLRDRQVPDVYGSVIPRQVTAGKAHWSLKGGEQHALVGRLEQVDLARGLSLTASCGACCPNSQVDAFMSPGSIAGYPGGTWQLQVYLAERDCFGSSLPWYPYPALFSFFSSTDPTVATIDNGGHAHGVSPGNTLIQSTIYGETYHNCAAEAANEEYCCDATPIQLSTENTCEVQPSIAIEVNQTPAQNDDVVQVQSTVPARRPKAMARARALGNPAQDVTAVIASPDGRLRFPEATNTTRSLTLPRTGAWVDFELSGESASAAKDDAAIEAHCGSASGPVCGRENATVFSFDTASIKVTAVGKYELLSFLEGGVYTPLGEEPTVTYEAQASLKPSGLDCTVAPLKDLRVGVMQNTEGVTRAFLLSDPEVMFDANVPSGTHSTVPEKLRVDIVLPEKLNDTRVESAPLYDRTGSLKQIDPNSTVLPGGCGQAAVPKATTSDTPKYINGGDEYEARIDGTTNRAGVVVYHKTEAVAFADHFRTWAAIWDMTPTGVFMLRETTWLLDVNSTRTTDQKATPATSDATATTAPVIDPPYANDKAAEPGNTQARAFGTATRLFVKP